MEKILMYEMRLNFVCVWGLGFWEVFFGIEIMGAGILALKFFTKILNWFPPRSHWLAHRQFNSYQAAAQIIIDLIRINPITSTQSIIVSIDLFFYYRITLNPIKC